MKRDTDPGPRATRAIRAIPSPEDGGPPSRAEIEAGLDSVVPGIVREFSRLKAQPGWHVAYSLGVNFMRVGQGSIPTLSDDRAAVLVKLAETDPHAFDAAAYIAGLQVAVVHLTGGLGLPAPLRMFATRVLAGELRRPKPGRGGRPWAGNVPLLTWQYTLCQFVKERGGLGLGRNRETEGAFNACQAVADAFTRAGWPTSYGDLETLCYGEEGQPPYIRALAEALGVLDFTDLDGGG